MKGYLKSREGLFQLSTKCTSIGNDECDLIVKDPSGSCVRAVIEYTVDNSCFVLKDLNSLQGIYINDCHIQNASVRLEPNDIIRFIYNGMPYEFLVECPPKAGIIGVRSSCLRVSDSSCSNGPPGQLSMKSSARSARTLNSTLPSNSSIGSDAGWISGPRTMEVPKEPSTSQCSVQSSESEKGDLLQQVKGLTSEVERLRMFESECAAKDDVIEQLHEEVTNLQTFIRQVEVGCCSECHNLIGNGNTKLLQLAEDMDCKQVKSDISCEQGESLSPNAIAAISKMRDELQKTKIDCDFSMGLVCQLERDMCNKDKTISCMAIELERVKRDLVEREVEISVLESSLLRLQENNKIVDSESTEVIENMSDSQFDDPQVCDLELACRSKDREIALLQRKLKMSDCRKLELDAQVRTLTQELAKMTTQCDAAKLAEKRTKAEVDTLKFKSQDLERVERLARVDIEQLSKRLEMLRSRAVQVAYAGSGVKAPDKLISDEDLFAMLRKAADDRVEASKKAQMAESVSSIASDKRSVGDARKSKP